MVGWRGHRRRGCTCPPRPRVATAVVAGSARRDRHAQPRRTPGTCLRNRSLRSGCRGPAGAPVRLRSQPTTRRPVGAAVGLERAPRRAPVDRRCVAVVVARGPAAGIHAPPRGHFSNPGDPPLAAVVGPRRPRTADQAGPTGRRDDRRSTAHPVDCGHHPRPSAAPDPRQPRPLACANNTEPG